MSKREDILAATRDLIVEDGLQSISFSKIFARAGVGSGTVYNYFAGKEELVNTLYRETDDLMDREILAGYDPSASLKDRFRTLTRNMAEFVLTHRKELAVLVACGHSPYIAENLRLRVKPSMAAALALFAEGQEKGLFVPMDKMLALMLITGAVVAVAQGHLDGKYPLEESAVDQAVEACWRSLAFPREGRE